MKDFIDPEMEKKFIVLQNLGHKCNGCFFSTPIKMSVGLLSALMVVMAAAYASYSEEPSARLLPIILYELLKSPVNSNAFAIK